MLIAVRRTVAQGGKWKIVPRHPLAEEGYELLDYDDGIEAIEWQHTQSPRDYEDRECKVACMAECLAPSPVGPKKFFSLYTKTDQVHSAAKKLADKHGVVCHVNLAPYMFAGGGGGV